MPISAEFPHPKRHVDVDGVDMAYVEIGTGAPIVFLHGNPTSSYLWRNVVPHVASLGRCILPDLIGMGDSARVPDAGPASYTFVEHRHYLDGLLAALGVDRDVTLVVHDWGSALGFDWANRHRDAVVGIAYMEAIVRPLRWDDWPPAARKIFEGFRSPAGEAMVLDKNLFVEAVLPGSVIRPLTATEMDEYRRPYLRTWRGPPPHPDLAPTDPHRRRTGRRRRDRHQLRRLAGHERRPQAARRRRTGRHPQRRPARVLPRLAEPDRGHRGRQPLPPGGQPGRDRRRDRRVARSRLIAM